MRRFLTIVLIVLLASSLGIALDGRTFDPKTGLDTRRYPPDPQVDWTHLKLDLRMPDPSSKSFTCTQTLTFKTLGRPVARLKLDAVNLDVRSVTDLSGKQLDFRNDEKHLTVTFRSELAPQSDGGVVVEYACANPTDGMIFALPDEAYHDRPLMVHTQGQAETNRHWFAAHDYPNERCTSETIVTVPAKYKVLANGKLVSKQDVANGMTRWHHSLGRPHVSYLVSIVIGEFEVVTDKWRDIPVEYWVPPGQHAGAMRTFGKTPKMMDLFSRLTGADYPYEKYAQSVVYLFNAGGMENTSTTTLHEMSVMDERAALDQDLEGLIAHELAHQWFGDMITCKSWAHVWLNEGFATYFDALWHEYEHGRDVYDDDLWHTMRNVAHDAAPDPRGGLVFFHYDDPWETFRRGGGNNAYSKGSSVLHMLRQSLGDELFFKCIREYVRRHAWKQPETDDLRQVIEELSGSDYERFFQQWVYRSGAPDVKASYEWDEDAKLARVTLEQRQEFTRETPAFACDVDVWLVNSSGNTSKHTVTMDGRSSSGALPCASEPKQVVIDPYSAVLMKLEPDLPTNLLVEQALRGPTTMARFGAIAALKTEDRDNVRRALREIVFDEKTFYGLRSEAARTLGAMQADGARAILLEALGDGTTIAHHRVRRAVVEALGQYRHPDVVKTLARFAHADPSYAVEAEASKALGKQDPTDDVLDALVANADKKSWRDQIRTAAVEALGNLGDARGIEPSMKLASYGQPFRSRSTGFEALGKLARGVDEKQRDEIRRFLLPLTRDPQERSARAAINALGAAGDERALDDLRRIADSSAPEELRQAARGAIDAINAKSGESTTVRSLRERIEALERDRDDRRRDGVAEDKVPATAPATAPAR